MLSSVSPTLSFLLLGSLITTVCTLILTPKRETMPASTASVLALQVCLVGLILWENPIAMALFWSLAPLPVLLRTRQFRGAFSYYQNASSVIFIIATGCHFVLGVSPATQTLFVLAGWIRLGMFPFHGSALSLAGEKQLANVIPWLSSQMGAIALVHYAPSISVFWGWLAAIGALYFALLACVQMETRRLTVLISLAGTSVALSGLLNGHIPGTSMQWFAASMATLGFCSTAWLTFARMGNLTGGLAASIPGISMFFLIFGLCAAGIPGSFTFVSTELLFGALFFEHLVQGSIVIIAFSLMTIAVYVGFVKIFQGQPRVTLQGLDLQKRERVGLMLAAAAILIPCLMAGPISKWIDDKEIIQTSNQRNRNETQLEKSPTRTQPRS